jgi:glycosyltransferase involved in cell wall biosynthesis
MQLGLVIYGDLETRSGGYLYDRQLVKELEKAGDEVEVISIPFRGYNRNLVDNLSKSILQRCLQGGFDLLLQDELNHPSLFYLNRSLRRISTLPLVSIVHHLRASEGWAPHRKRLYEQIERSFLTTLNGVICNSHATARSVQELAQLPSMVMVPGRDHIQPAMDSEWVATRSMHEGPLQLVFLGNVIARKGLLTLLEALVRLPKGSWELTVVGDLAQEPKYTIQVKYLIAASRFEKNVRIVGSVPPMELAKLLRDSDLMVVPSRYEGFGIVYLEAMGYGVPVVATSAGGARELVRDWENGFLVDPGDTEGLAEILRHLIFNREPLRTLSLGALQTYWEHPTWGEGAKLVRKFLQSLIGEIPQAER